MLLPAASLVVTVKLQAPLALAVAVPSTVVPSLMVTTANAPAVPTRVGVASSVTPPSATLPVTLPALSSTLSMLTSTALVSTVMTTGVLGKLVLPAGSVAVVVMLWGPSPSGVVGVTLQVPLGPTVVVPITVPGLAPSVTVMVSPGVPVPVKVGVLSSVVPPGAIVPVCGATLSVSVGVPGAAGLVVSKVIGYTPLAGLVTPFWLITAVNSCVPWLVSAGVVKVHCPLASTVAVPNTVVPS